MAADVVESDESLRIDRLTAEFADPATEQDYRDFISARRVRDTQTALYLAAVFYLAFAVTDYMAMHGDSEYGVVLSLRLAICAFGLSMAKLAPRFADQLVNGAIPSLVTAAAMAVFLYLTFLRSFQIGWHGMAMMTMLYGSYVFIPNRYPAALLIGVVSSMVFLGLSSALFQLDIPELARLFTLIVVTNVLGAMASYRISRIMREEYREHVVLRVANQRLHDSYAERLRLEDALRRKAEIDDVTGVANRSAFFEGIERLSNQGGGLPTPMCLLLLDIDYFRQINGTYGHLRSDGVLRAVVAVCHSLLAKDQTIARIGGEEFVVLLPGVELAQAGHLAERIREECARSPVAMGDVFVHFTVSIGVVHHRGGESFNMMLRRVDEAAAAAKFKGRNRIEVVA